MEWKIIMSSGHGTVYDYCGGLTYDEALDICESYNWTWADENEFDWDLEIVEDI